MNAALTPREREVAELLWLSNKDIASRLRIAAPTVRKHVYEIMSKTGSCSRTEAALKHHGVLR